jgi:hypothetical protein
VNAIKKRLEQAAAATAELQVNNDLLQGEPQPRPAPAVVPMLVDPTPQANAFGPANPPALLQLPGTARQDFTNQPPNKRGRKGGSIAGTMAK